MTMTSVTEMDLHKGEAILHLAGTYPELFQVIEEGIQNALDKEASRINVTLNRRQRRIAIRDNGQGINAEGFDEVIKSVGKSVKTAGKLGRFGLGLVSPLGKCDHFTFISCAFPERNSYLEWTLNTKDIKAQANRIAIPRRSREDLAHQDSVDDPIRGKNNVWWRTEVDIYNFIDDGVITNVDIDQLKASVLNKFSAAMLKNRTQIVLNFTDEKGELQERKFRGDCFTGTTLPEMVYNLNDCGEVVFRMYLTTKRQRESRDQRKTGINIRFGEIGNDYRITFASFGKSVAHSDISPESETMDALRSGIFEGEILGEKIRVTKERTYFTRDDALVDFYIAIDKWYKEHGKKYYTKAKSESRDERYQKLGIQSLDSLEKLLKSPEHSTLLTALRQIAAKGTIGRGHTEPANRVVKDEQSSASKATNGAPDKSKGSGIAKPSRSREGQQENQAHVPFSVQGPDGNQRKTVKSNSTGLQFRYDTLVGSRDLWDLDREYGVITFNVTHPDWVMCDTNDAMICTLQEYVTIQVLTLELLTDQTSYLVHRRFSDESTSYFLRLMVQKGGNLSRKGRQPREQKK